MAGIAYIIGLVLCYLHGNASEDALVLAQVASALLLRQRRRRVVASAVAGILATVLGASAVPRNPNVHRDRDRVLGKIAELEEAEFRRQYRMSRVAFHGLLDQVSVDVVIATPCVPLSNAHIVCLVHTPARCERVYGDYLKRDSNLPYDSFVCNATISSWRVPPRYRVCIRDCNQKCDNASVARTGGVECGIGQHSATTR